MGLGRVGVGILLVAVLIGVGAPAGSGAPGFGRELPSAGPRDPVGAAAYSQGAPHPTIGSAVAPPSPCSGWSNATFNLSLVAQHLHIDDLRTPLSLFAVCKLPVGVLNSTKLAWRWSPLPPGCQPGPNQTAPGSFLKCTPRSAWSGRIVLTAFANNTNISGPRFKASDDVSVTINATVSVLLGADPRSGGAPLTTNLSTEISGGTPPFTISWLTGDQNIGLGRYLSHTYLGPGTYRVEVWVNDSTVSFAANQSWFGTFNVTVTAGAAHTGLLGLRGPVGWAVLAAIVGGVVSAVLYVVLVARRRGPRLPRPERWMVPDPERPGRSPGEPRVPPRPPPSK